jgi:hypothetical protein
LINTRGRLEVKASQEPIWGVYAVDEQAKHPMPKLFEVLVYFKGTYGVDKGSIEYLVNTDDLISQFKERSFKLVEKNNLDQIKNKYYFKMSKTQLRVSKYHMVLVFEKL